MREELAEHECVVRLGVVAWEADVLVHVERDDMFESIHVLAWPRGRCDQQKCIY